MYGRFNKIIITILLATVSFLYSSVPGDLKVLGIRVDFPLDDNEGTTGDGKFLLSSENIFCDYYTVDPPPHDKSYFESQFKAVNSYYRSVSNGQFGIDLENSAIYPIGLNDAFTMPEEMAYYNPLGSNLSADERIILHEERITQLFSDALTTAYQTGTINFNQYDIVVVFHAGVSQDFKIDLDTTPEDIPSTFIDHNMINKYISETGIYVGDTYINEGIILPETQNHILYEESVEYFQQSGVQDVCEYQFGLTGTFTLMIGQAIGLPTLWNTETGQSGIGIFGLMDQGSNNGQGLIPAPLSPWSRLKMGWQESVIVIPDMMIELESQPQGSVLKVDINESEYFLIENRTNWFRSNVSMDSVKLHVYNETDKIPNTVKLIFDSIDVDIDENGVIVAVPNYDIGLPGSGLLIWHIDEKIINDKFQDNSINNDPKHKGIDIEEAGGPQDIGYASTALFRDPSLGEPYDMWYAGNPEYEELNTSFNNSIEFSPFTFPNTNSNSGALSNLTISNIGPATNAMQISITNNLTLPGFPDTSLHILYHTDFNGDGKSELIGGTEELWWSETDNFDKKAFYQLPSDENYYTITGSNNNKNLVIVSNLGDSLKYVWFEFDNGFEMKNEIIQQNIYDSIDHIIGNNNDQHVFPTSDCSIIDLVNSKNGDNVVVSILSDGGVSVEENFIASYLPIYYDEIIFDYISAIDLNNDGKIEVLTLDSDGNIFGLNKNYTFATGFPVEYRAVSPILAKDILGDKYPEIIFKNRNGELLILNNIGELQYRLSGNKNSKLIMLGEHDKRNTIVTESNIWVFDEISENGRNQWTTWYGDEYNSNTIEINYLNEINSDGKLFDKKRTYIYPNPVHDNIAKIRIFNYTAEKVKISIYDLAGYFIDEIIEKIDINYGVWEAEWDVRNVESGVYLINLTASKGNKEESTILKVGVIH